MGRITMEKISMWTAMCTGTLLSLVMAGVMGLLILTGSTLPRFTGDTAALMRLRMPMLLLQFTGQDGVLGFPLVGEIPVRRI